jgi:hypothetical protein
VQSIIRTRRYFPMGRISASIESRCTRISRGPMRTALSRPSAMYLRTVLVQDTQVIGCFLNGQSGVHADNLAVDDAEARDVLDIGDGLVAVPVVPAGFVPKALAFPWVGAPHPAVLTPSSLPGARMSIWGTPKFGT